MDISTLAGEQVTLATSDPVQDAINSGSPNGPNDEGHPSKTIVYEKLSLGRAEDTLDDPNPQTDGVGSQTAFIIGLNEVTAATFAM
jgi:hypothetical protein